MEPKEYLNGLKLIEENAKALKRKLASEFVFKNKKFKINQIIQQGETKILIDKISIYFGFSSEIPQPVYSGKELTKKLIPMKNDKVSSIYGDKDVIEIFR